MKKWIPWIFVALCAAWFLGGAATPPLKNGFDVTSWGRLPVLLNGRVQPLDSVARNSLLSISGISVVHTTHGDLSPSEWLLEAMTRPEIADNREIFRVQHPDLAGLICGTPSSGLTNFSFNEMTNRFPELRDQAEKINALGGGEDSDKLLNPFQRDLKHLVISIELYDRIKNSLEPVGADEFPQELADYEAAIPLGRIALDNTDAGKPANQDDLNRISFFFKRYSDMADIAYPLMVPPAPDQPRRAWSNVGTNLLSALASGKVSQPVKYFADMSVAYRQTNAVDFNRAVAGYRAWLQGNNLYPEIKKAGQEFFFNQIQPFYVSMVIYILAVTLACVYWINLSPVWRESGFKLLVLAFIIHTFGLLFRMYLQGRPPVTNLYSASVFIGWAAVIFGMALERIFKGGIGVVCSGLIGFITLNIAHHLALNGDTMEMLRAVLDTNLWLSTHVVVVTLGYASMFVAGLLAIIYVVRGYFTKSLTPELGRTLARMAYGIVCFATLFSFVGTILGGIWADQSWGRFWGWDPKENGALLIVLWNAIILHARWGGLVKERGLMPLAIFGNIVTSFSMFGVNMLGIGLHSYGFTNDQFTWLLFFDATQVALIVLAVLPARHWASFHSREIPPAATPQAT